jgi:hypothetical protein
MKNTTLGARFLRNIATNITQLKPDFNAAPNPFALLQRLLWKQWLFFLVSSLPLKHCSSVRESERKNLD